MGYICSKARHPQPNLPAMKKSVLLLALAGAAFLYAPSASAQIVTTNTMTPQQLVQNVLLGQGIQAFNITFTGYPNAIGKFTAGNSATPILNIDSGIVITTGTALDPDPTYGTGFGPQGPNNGGSVGVDNLTPGDSQLDGLSTAQTFNASVLEFDFIPLADTVKFDYVFGSDEYPEFVNSTFNDIFAFFLSGVTVTLPPTNIALVPSTSIPVAINNVNNGTTNSGPCMNCAYYVDNSVGSCVEYDGFTTVLTAKHEVQCGETYHIKIAIADVGDGIYDSGVFLRANSFTSSAVVIDSHISYGGPNDSTLFEGCGQACLYFIRSAAAAAVQADTVQVTISGNAQNGVDITPAIPTQVIFPLGVDSVQICFSAPQDNISEGLDTLYLHAVQNIPCAAALFTDATIYIGDITPVIAVADDTSECSSTGPVTLSVNATGGVQPYTYQWSTGATTTSITVTPTQTTSYTVTVTDYCNNSVGIDTATVYFPTLQPLAINTGDVSVCQDSMAFLSATGSGGAGNFQYHWYHVNGPGTLSTPNNSSTTVGNNTDTSSFMVVIIDGCGDSTTRLVNVLTNDCNIAIPNVFTPNGDGTNDFFVITGIETFPGSHLTIFDRWGIKVYDDVNYLNNWNGRSLNGKDATDGTYYYVLNVSDGRAYHGFVTLLRAK